MSQIQTYYKGIFSLKTKKKCFFFYNFKYSTCPGELPMDYHRNFGFHYSKIITLTVWWLKREKPECDVTKLWSMHFVMRILKTTHGAMDWRHVHGVFPAGERFQGDNGWREDKRMWEELLPELGWSSSRGDIIFEDRWDFLFLFVAQCNFSFLFSSLCITLWLFSPLLHLIRNKARHHNSSPTTPVFTAIQWSRAAAASSLNFLICVFCSISVWLGW